MWNEITSHDDLDDFMNLFSSFHDSCIKEFKYISGAYVDENLSMYPTSDKKILRMIIHRQFKNPSVIEMEFIRLKRLVMFPIDENYSCEILGATMIIKEDCIYWCDCNDLSESDFNNYEGTLICASKVRWRAADEYIGEKEIYVSP